MNIKFIILAFLSPLIVFAQEPMAQSDEKPLAASASKAPLSADKSIFLFDETREVQGEKPLGNLKGERIGDVRLTIRDQKGEPLARDIFVKVEVKCSGHTSFKTIAPAFTTCSFKGLEHDRDRNALIIHYQPPTVINGRFGCDVKTSMREIKISCNP